MKNFIKRLTTISYICISLGYLAGCGSDDDNSPAGLPLVGTTWTETKYVAAGCTDTNDNESTTETCSATRCYTIRLNDGVITFVNIEDGITDTSTSTYTAVTATTVTVDFGSADLTINYTISGSTLVITFTDPSDGCSVTATYVGAA